AAYETGELTNFAVDKRQERKGYGALLLKAGLAALKAQGVKQVTLEVNENNRAALGLYIRFNFKQIGARKKFYDNEQNAVLMKGVL
ncbi:MAG: GNAT family N-acetyltransferase, partial [Elusimicrobiota bacterium]|nr:GNAT family N-acetyltransferase [Elusimicrobiota bacterium]